MAYTSLLLWCCACHAKTLLLHRPLSTTLFPEPYFATSIVDKCPMSHKSTNTFYAENPLICKMMYPQKHFDNKSTNTFYPLKMFLKHFFLTKNRQTLFCTRCYSQIVTTSPRTLFVVFDITISFSSFQGV